MELEKPLHVQVAEVLGYGECAPCGEEGIWHFAPGQGTAYRDDFSPSWRDIFDYGERHRCDHDLNSVPNFDMDWSATGPLIEKYGIEVMRSRNGWTASGGPKAGGTLHSPGATPLLAICDLLITAASEFGGLKAA